MLELIRNEVHFGRTLACFVDRATHLNELLAHTVSRHGAREALVDGERRYTYTALDAHAERVAAGFVAHGLGPGDRLVILAANRAEFVVALWAALRVGVIAVPVNVREARPEIGFIAKQCGAKAIVHDAALADRVPATDEAPTLALRFTAEALPESDAPVAAHAPTEEDTAVILYTSGTTGRPKGAMLTHLNLVHSIEHYRIGMLLGPADRSVLAVPASHVTGLVAILLSMAGVGGCVLVLREFKVPAFLALAARERMTHTLVVPAIYNLLLRDPAFTRTDLASWRVGGFGGAPMPEGTVRALAAALPRLTLQNCYGSTETTSPTTMMPPGLQASRLNSVGRALACADVRIRDDDGRELPAGETGEIHIGGPQVVPGYWDNPEATAREFEGGYWRSGDIGMLDADGFLYLFDRKKDVVNRGGYKVYCAEVESVLSLAPGIAEVAIVPRPDPVLGEKSVAHVWPGEADFDEAAARAHCAAHLADYKVPDFFVVRGSPLPRNANGKVLKRELPR